MLIREIFQARPPVLDLVLTLLTDINMYSYNCINIAHRHTGTLTLRHSSRKEVG